MEIGPEVVRRAQAGDRDALRKLVEAAYPSVRRWALVRTGDPADAEDLTQDVMIQMIRKLGAYRGTAPFSTWLYTITRHAAADRFRHAKRKAELVHDPRTVEAFTPREQLPLDDQIDRSDLTGMVRVFFEDLPSRQREVFDLVELNGLTSAEAGERMGIEPVSVRAHLFKARKALRQQILDANPELAEELP